MSVKAIVTKEEYDALDATLQTHYGQNSSDKKYYLSVTAVDGWELGDGGSLKKSLQQERENLKKANQKLKTFDGIEDPEAARDALKKVSELVEGDTSEEIKVAREAFETQLKTKYEGEQKKLTEKHTTDLEALSGTNSGLLTQLQGALIDMQAAKAIADAGGNYALLIGPVKSQTKMIDKDGIQVAVVIDQKDGLERLSAKPGSSELMSVVELVEEMKEDEVFSVAFTGSGASGGGATGDAGGGKPPGNVHTAVPVPGDKRFQLTEEAAVDPATYRAMREESLKHGQLPTIK